MSGTGFFRSGDEKVFAIFTSQEAHVLINLTEQILELLGEDDHVDDAMAEFMSIVGISTNDAPPQDPVLHRLLPDAYADAHAAGEFRRYTEHGLREKKRAHASALREALLAKIENPSENEIDVEVESSDDEPLNLGKIEIEVPLTEIMDWLGGLNDIRLALAVRLGIEKPPADEAHKKYELMKESDPMKAVYAVYSWLGWLQESLIKLL